MVSDREILHKIAIQPKKSAAYKQLVRELGVRGEERQRLAARLDKLVERGELVEMPGDRYGIAPTGSGAKIVIGRLSMHRDGYGFVIPESETLKRQIRGDIFIGARDVGTAMHGDRVKVEVGRIRPDGRAEGRIVHRGRTVATSEGDVKDASGKLYAHATTTCMIFPGKG